MNSETQQRLSTADRAREVAKQIKPSQEARSEAIMGLLNSPGGPAAAAAQQKRIDAAAGLPGNRAVAAAPASPGTAARGLTTPQPAAQQPQEPSAPGSSAAASHQAAVAADLASATTSAGPIIMTTPEASAEAQQALSLLNSYDFKIYGQGLTAGAQAVPLAPDQKVMYKPPPEPTPAAGASAAAAENNYKPAAPSQATAVANGQAAAISMRPLPEASRSSVSAFQPGATAATTKPSAASAAAAIPEQGSTAHAAPLQQQQQQLPASGRAVNAGGVCQALEQAQQQVQQQVQQQLRHRKPAVTPPGQAASASSAAPTYPVGSNYNTVIQDALAKEMRMKLNQEQQGQYTPGQRQYIKDQQYRQYKSGGAVQPGGTGKASMKARAGGWLQRTWLGFKDRVVEGLETAAAWLLHVLWLGVMWVANLLLTPLTAVFGPWYRYNRRLKARSLELLGCQVDLNELQEALGALPSWLQGVGGATEKLAWLNSMLAQVWPILDPVVCALIKSTIEPLLDDMKPPFIAAMGFQKLTLGELPVELEGIRVVGGEPEGDSADQDVQSTGQKRKAAACAAKCDDRLEVEVDFHWVGEPNISFFVEMAMAGPYTRLVPKVSHLTSRGTLRLGLTRMVPQLPCVGAILVSLARTPQVKFTLDFGPALGGRFTAKPVAAFLDPFLRDTLANLVVWPNRFVVPLMDRSVTGNLDDLALHSVGVLEVEVLSAKHLPKKGGALSTVDPQVEIWTQPQHHVFSSVKKSTRNPNWRGQVLEVLVQEPDSQQLRVVLNDIDMLNLKELLQVNLLKGAANLVRSANPIGRAALPLRDICDKPFKRQEVEVKLSSSDWAYELGIVDEDNNQVLQLALTYKPFQELRATSTAPIACKGVLLVDVRQCQDLASADWDSTTSDPYVLLKVAGQKQQTVVVPHTTAPVYNAHFEFFNVQVPDTLLVQVWDRDYLKPDDLIGYVELPVQAMLTWTQGGGRGWRDGWWRLKKKGGMFGHKKDDGTAGRIEMKVRYRPYSS